MITGEKFDEDQFLRIKLDMAMQTAHDFSNSLIETNSQVWNLREHKYFKLGTKYLFMASANRLGSGESRQNRLLGQ